VTHVDEADVTALGELRAQLKPEAGKKGLKLSPLPFIVKAVVFALKQFPALNASLDDERQEIVPGDAVQRRRPRGGRATGGASSGRAARSRGPSTRRSWRSVT